MENEMIRNEAVIRGTIVSIHGKNNNGSMTIACPLITYSRHQGVLESNVRVNFPVLSFNKDTKTEGILENFKTGDRVYVCGYIQSYLRMDESGDTREIMNVYISTILHDISKLESAFGKTGKVFPEAINEVYICGKLTGIVKRTHSVLTLRVDVSKVRKNILELVYYNAPAAVLQNLNIGDEVELLAMVQTVNTKEKVVIRNYQDLVVLDIA